MAEEIRVLLVDDDEDEFVIVGDLLRAAGTDKFNLTWAPTYEQGLEAILSARCDVCLVDYRLGQRNGLDLLAEVTAKSSHQPVILLTGEGDRELDLTATKAGAADYLVKGELTAALLERSIRYSVERARTLKTVRNANDLAQSANLAKSSFLAAMSHEIRTPMNAILGMADMLWESPLNAEQMRYVEVFRRAGSVLLTLIDDILDLSKIEAGQLELERVGFDLEEVVNQVIELTAVKARSRGIALLAHLSPGLATSVVGDPTRLRQVLINLLGNAVKFTDSGEVVLTARNDDSGKPGQIEFAISDTGIGIPADKLERIFDDFSQAEASTTRRFGGTGLGLGISRRLVEAMGGRLTATSSPGSGSTFRFTAQFEPAPAGIQKGSGAPASLRGKRVLVVAHNATHRLILQETLQAWGMEIDAFRLPAEALGRLPEAMDGDRPYSLVVIDSGRPGMDSFKATAAIRRIAWGVPIVMLTTDTQPGPPPGNHEADLSGCAVHQPVTRAHLLRLVCDALETPECPEVNPAAPVDCAEPEPVKPARILIAEDSPDNRLLVQVYMKDSPYHLTFEHDGRAAVDRFAAADFDLVLMDLQMPVMDGLTATSIIRALELERGTTPVPIVALTASASLQDIERSANAGCTAQLSKPISKRDLLSAVERFRRHVTQPGPLPIEVPPGIGVARGMEGSVPDYLATRRAEVREMAGLLAASDFARLSALAHQLKATGSSHGFPVLTRLGAALEQSAKQSDRGALLTQVTELGNYLNRVQLLLNYEASRTSREQAAPG